MLTLPPNSGSGPEWQPPAHAPRTVARRCSVKCRSGVVTLPRRRLAGRSMKCLQPRGSALPWPGCAVVRRAGRHIRSRAPRWAAEGQKSKPAIWDAWIVKKFKDTWLALLLVTRQSSHPGKGNVLLHFRYFFCSGICSAVTRSTGPPSCAPRGCHLEAGKEEILWRRHVSGDSVLGIGWVPLPD